MNGEREIYKGLPSEEELDEDLIFLAYAAQEGIPFKYVFDGMQFEVDPYGFDKYYENRTKQQYYMLMGLLYEKAPSGDLEFESARMISGLIQYKNRFIDDPVVQLDAEGHEAVESMNVVDLAEFLSFVHADYLDDAKAELENGDLSEGTVSKLALWSRIVKIADMAVDRFGEDMAA